MKEKEAPGEWERRIQVYDFFTRSWKHFRTIQEGADDTLAKILRNAYPQAFRIIRVKKIKTKEKKTMIEKIDAKIAEFEKEGIKRDQMLIMIRRDAFIELAQDMRLSAEEAGKAYDKATEILDRQGWDEVAPALNFRYDGISTFPWRAVDHLDIPFFVSYLQL